MSYLPPPRLGEGAQGGYAPVTTTVRARWRGAACPSRGGPPPAAAAAVVRRDPGGRTASVDRRAVRCRPRGGWRARRAAALRTCPPRPSRWPRAAGDPEALFPRRGQLSNGCAAAALPQPHPRPRYPPLLARSTAALWPPPRRRCPAAAPPPPPSPHEARRRLRPRRARGGQGDAVRSHRGGEGSRGRGRRCYGTPRPSGPRGSGCGGLYGRGTSAVVSFPSPGVVCAFPWGGRLGKRVPLRLAVWALVQP